MARKRILFVDDDPTVLAGLRGGLASDRERWDMAFAYGPEAALVELSVTRFDAIVSDMTMPYVDGQALLEHVRTQSPKTRRVILSADAKEVPAAEEILTKPISARTLREALERLLA